MKISKFVIFAVSILVITGLNVSCSESDPDPGPIIGTDDDMPMTDDEPGDGDGTTDLVNIDLSGEWEFSAPSEEGVSDLTQVISNAANLTRLTSLVVVKNGKVITEEYFKGFKKDSLHDVRSVTKSVMSILVGIAIDQGKIESVNSKIGDFLSDDAKYGLSPAQKEITIRDLLTMSAGFEWDEWNSSDYNDWILSGEQLQFLLDRPLVDDPGTQFSYNSASTYLLGLVLSEAVELPFYEFADTVLFNNFSAKEVGWEGFSNGTVNGGSGIRLETLDMAKIGQLLLQKGRSGDTNIVSENWVNDMTTPAYPWRVIEFGAIRNYTYGRLWWVQDDPTHPAYLAWGFGGQYIYVVPNLNLVVVITTDWRNSTAAGGAALLEQQALDLIINQIVPKAN